MYVPIEVRPRIGTVEIEGVAFSLMDAPTALHCAECGETLYDGRCMNAAGCIEAGRKASRGGSTAKYESGMTSGPMFAPRAWTLGGRVD
jgi:hypothetical protein